MSSVDFKLLAIPCYYNVPMSDTDIEIIRKGVQNTWGGVSLHPEVQALFRKEVEDGQKKINSIAFETLRQLILAEHTISQHYNDFYNKDGMELEYRSGITNYTYNLAIQINKCIQKHPLNPKALRGLNDGVLYHVDELRVLSNI